MPLTFLNAKRSTLNARRGFTLIEFLIVFSILMLIGGGVYLFQSDLLRINAFLQKSFFLQRDATVALREMVAHVRAANQSSVGDYPLEDAQPFSFTFYANADSDPLIERIRYAIEGTNLVRRVTKPAGSPLTYSAGSAQETVAVMLPHVITSDIRPLFRYFDETYAGAVTAVPLGYPLDITDVRHVEVTIIADEDAALLPPALIVASNATVRNLKDNY